MNRCSLQEILIWVQSVINKRWNREAPLKDKTIGRLTRFKLLINLHLLWTIIAWTQKNHWKAQNRVKGNNCRSCITKWTNTFRNKKTRRNKTRLQAIIFHLTNWKNLSKYQMSLSSWRNNSSYRNKTVAKYQK